SFPRVAAWIALVVLTVVVATGLAGDATEAGDRPNILLGWLALAATALALGAGLWDEPSRASVAGLYLLGLSASGWTVHQFHLLPRWLVWTGTMVLSAYSLATSYLWSQRTGLRAFADRLRIPRPATEDPDAGLAWLVPANLTLAG